MNSEYGEFTKYCKILMLTSPEKIEKKKKSDFKET